MITPEKARVAIQQKIASLQQVCNSSEFWTWQVTASNTLSYIYSEKDERIRKFMEISSVTLYTGRDVTNEAKKEAKEILESIISDIEHFGIPKLTNEQSGKGVNLHVNQVNQQTQTTSITINLEIVFEALKSGLRDTEIEELKEILASSQEPKVKKKNFMGKIKSFGSDVASNILANILTNPQVYEQLGKNL